MDPGKKQARIILEQPQKIEFDYKTLQQVIKDAEETRRRSIEIQEKLYGFLGQSENYRKSDSTTMKPLVQKDDIIEIRRVKDLQVIDVSVPRLEGKPVPIIEPIRTKDGEKVKKVKTLYQRAAKSEEKRPKTFAAPAKIKAPKKIASTQSLKETQNKSKLQSITTNKSRKSGESSKVVIKEKRNSKDSSTTKTKVSGSKPSKSKKTTEVTKVDKPVTIKEVEAKPVEKDRPDTAANVLLKSKELLDSIGRRDTVPATKAQVDIQDYLSKIGKRLQMA